jgi:hypothetical protein
MMVLFFVDYDNIPGERLEATVWQWCLSYTSIEAGFSGYQSERV